MYKGVLPLQYLRVPISSKTISTVDVDKQLTGGDHEIYPMQVIKVQLINLVLTHIHTYQLGFHFNSCCYMQEFLMVCEWGIYKDSIYWWLETWQNLYDGTGLPHLEGKKCGTMAHKWYPTQSKRKVNSSTRSCTQEKGVRNRAWIEELYK